MSAQKRKEVVKEVLRLIDRDLDQLINRREWLAFYNAGGRLPDFGVSLDRGAEVGSKRLNADLICGRIYSWDRGIMGMTSMSMRFIILRSRSWSFGQCVGFNKNGADQICVCVCVCVQISRCRSVGFIVEVRLYAWLMFCMYENRHEGRRPHPSRRYCSLQEA